MAETRSRPSSFDKLLSRYRITADLEAASALRVGAGKSFDVAATDQPLIRDGLGRPYIPGSSLKGALRSGLEQTLRGLGSEKLKSCDLFEEPCIKAADRGRNSKGLPFDQVQARICDVCGLFGSPFLAGRIFIHDLPQKSPDTSPPSEIRDGVGINRDLRTAQRGIKYDYEAVSPGTRFEMEILLENANEVQRALTFKLLEFLDEGQILLGGLTSRGLGRVRLRDVKVEHTDAARLLGGQGFNILVYDEEKRQADEALRNYLGQRKD